MFKLSFVVDNGSTGANVDRIAAFEDALTLIRQENQGKSAPHAHETQNPPFGG